MDNGKLLYDDSHHLYIIDKTDLKIFNLINAGVVQAEQRNEQRSSEIRNTTRRKRSVFGGSVSGSV